MKIQNIVKSIAARILFFVVFLLCANTLFAQIQTKILGCRVGTSTANEVMSILNQQGYTVSVVEYNKFSRDYFKSGDYSFEINGSILFGGVRWDYVTFTFIGKKLYSVSFNCFNFNKNAYDIQKKAYDKLLSDLKNKYSNYYKPDESGFFEFFRDNYTEINLKIIYGLSLTYSNIKLFKAKSDGVYSGGASDL